MSAAEPTPFDAALALHQAGASRDTIQHALEGRGLDAEAVALVLKAVLRRSRTEGVKPEAERWVDAPASVALAAQTPAPGSAPASFEAPAIACSRCGSFVAPAGLRHFKLKPYCPACFERPDVNYLEAYRRRKWGVRDGWAWFFGLFAVLSFLGGALALVGAPGFELIVVILALATAVAYGLFWGGVPIARPALVLVTLAAVAISIAQTGSFTGVVNILIVAGALTSTRNKLFFKLEVPEAALEKAWAAEYDNLAAKWSRALGVISLGALLPAYGLKASLYAAALLGLWALITGAFGLKAVNPDSTPPVGRRGTAVLGLVLGGLGLAAAALGLIFWGALHGQ